jgi:hypothetical protein
MLARKNLHQIRASDMQKHVLTRLLMMQADDSLPTRLTYGVKGPHMISREVEGEVWTTTLPQPTSTPHHGSNYRLMIT